MSLDNELKQRPATFSGSWYDSDPNNLSKKMANWIKEAKDNIVEWPKAPPKVLIVPHAGYDYSASTAAFSYAILERFKFDYKKIVLLGPSHKVHLDTGIQSSPYSSVSTPFGELSVMKDSSCGIKEISLVFDSSEHSLEMQFPFIKFIYKDGKGKDGKDVDVDIEILPIFVSNHNTSSSIQSLEKLWKDSCTLIIVSSDFFFFFFYYGYMPLLLSFQNNKKDINQYISDLDDEAKKAIEEGYESFKDYLERTENTICGRESILLVLKLISQFSMNKKGMRNDRSSPSTWTWLNYKYSSNVTDIGRSNRVGYVSGYYLAQ